MTFLMSESLKGRLSEASLSGESSNPVVIVEVDGQEIVGDLVSIEWQGGVIREVALRVILASCWTLLECPAELRMLVNLVPDLDQPRIHVGSSEGVFRLSDPSEGQGILTVSME